MEKILENLECYKVVHGPEDKKLTLCFIDKETDFVYKVEYNKQKYSDGSWVDDPVVAVNKEKMLFEDTGLEWNEIDGLVGEFKDVYFYSTPKSSFSALHHCDMISKLDVSMGGEIIDTTIKKVVVDKRGIHIQFDYNEQTYQSNMSFGEYEQDENGFKFLGDPQKKAKQLKKFKDFYGVDVEDAEQIVGNKILVEVKVLKMGKPSAYADIKKPSWGKK